MFWTRWNGPICYIQSIHLKYWYVANFPFRDGNRSWDKKLFKERQHDMLTSVTFLCRFQDDTEYELCSRALIAVAVSLPIKKILRLIERQKKKFCYPSLSFGKRRHSYNVSLRYITSFNSQKKPVKRHVEDLVWTKFWFIWLQSVGIGGGNQNFGTLMNVFFQEMLLSVCIYFWSFRAFFLQM